MQVVCGNCQLNFQAPDGTTGLVCPICRSPLQPQAGAEGAGAGKGDGRVIDWKGGTLDDLIAILTGPAICARVEVLPATGDTAAGEVHLLAGGVSEAIFAGKSTDDALDKLRAITPARFRVEPRLPNPADGDLTYPGPESGTLDTRPLAHLMRYSEDYVITCSIEVWRGSENARVEYRRGEIAGVTVGGIDAPERLAEVMKWSSGNYRIVTKPIELPAVAPKRPQAAAGTPAPVPAPAPSAQAARASSSATKTIFGMPAVDLSSAARAAAEAAASKPAAPAAAHPAPAAAHPAPAAAHPAPAPAAAAHQPAAASAAPPAAAPHVAAPVPAAAPPAAAVEAARRSASRTMVGVPVAERPAADFPATPARVTASPPRATAPATRAPAESEPARPEKKTGARKVVVPPPEISPPPPAAVAASAPPAATGGEVGRATHHGYDPTPTASVSGPPPRRVEPVSVATPAQGDRTEPTRLAPSQTPRQTSLLMYVGIGFSFGLALLGIYQLVGRLAH